MSIQIQLQLQLQIMIIIIIIIMLTLTKPNKQNLIREQRRERRVESLVHRCFLPYRGVCPQGWGPFLVPLPATGRTKQKVGPLAIPWTTLSRKSPRRGHTRHILPPSEIDLRLFWADFTDLEGKHLFHRIG